MGYTHNTEMSPHKGSVKMAELIKERTGGQVTITIYPNSQLGNEKDLVEQIKNGIIDLDNVSVGMLANFEGWGPAGVLSMPYLFKGETEEDQLPTFLKMTRGTTFKELSEKAAQASGIRALDIGWWYGLRQLTTKNRQIAKVEDMKGLKVRTPDAPIQKLAMSALGASVTPMAWAEVYSALQLGVVDAQENPLNTIYTSKLYEVQKYVALTGHMTQNQVIIVNDKKFQSFSPELKDIFIKAAIEAGDYQNQMQVNANKQNLQDLKDKGMTVTTINKAEFAEKTKDAWKELESTFGKGFYEKVRDELAR
jgi:tripartite ATP-independent transporter DctP family solute receptor